MMPLEGKRILVTRASHQAGRLAEELEAYGAEVLRLPTIQIIPPETYAHLDALLEAIPAFHWMIFTSANAVAAVEDRVQFLRIPHHRLQHLQIAAVGPATAKAVAALGLKIACTPGEYVAEAVVALLKPHVAGKRVLLARAAVARDVIPQQLRECGADIHVAEAYRTIIPESSIARARELFAPGTRLPDAITFTSSSTVTNFLSLLSAAELERPPQLRAVSIGPVTTATLQSNQWVPAAQAAKSDIPGLVDACVKLLS